MICRYRLSLTEAGLATGLLFVRHIPPPTTVEYQDHAERFTHADGRQAEHGYKHVEFSWDALTQGQAFALNRLVEGAGTGYLYATIDKQDGSSPAEGWIDVRGWAHPLTTERLGNEDGAIGSAVRVVLRIDNLSILNSPSIYV